MARIITKYFFVSLALCFFIFGVAHRINAEPPILSKLSGAEKERVSKLIEGAKKEGKLVGYSSLYRPDVQAVLIPKFRSEYALSESDLKINIVAMRSGPIVTKTTEELKSKVYVTDFVNGEPGWFNDLVARGELMAYNSPEYKKFHPLSADPKIAMANPPYYISGISSIYGITYNPKFIKEKIVSWKDVLKPQFKGKVCCGDVSKSFNYTNGYFPLRKALGIDYFKQLGKQEPYVTVAVSHLLNKVISGEYPIVVICSMPTAFRTNLKGAGLKLVLPQEGIPAIGYPFAILQHAPHPSAAKLFMDFVHGEWAQNLQLKLGYVVGRLGLTPPYPDTPDYPAPIYALKNVFEVNWLKITNADRLSARKEFRKLVIERR